MKKFFLIFFILSITFIISKTEILFKDTKIFAKNNDIEIQYSTDIPVGYARIYPDENGNYYGGSNILIPTDEINKVKALQGTDDIIIFKRLSETETKINNLKLVY